MTIENRDALGSVDGQVYLAAWNQSLYKASLGNGVISNTVANTKLKVDDGGTANMLVYVGAGKCVINGLSYSESSTAALTIGSGHVSYQRFDAVVYDQSAGTAKVVAGTGSANPQIPDVDDDNDIYLAAVLVPTAEVTSITNAEIYDLRAFVRTYESCIMELTTAQVLTSGSTAGIQWTNEVYDVHRMHAAGTADIVVHYDGIYGFNAQVEFGANTTGARLLSVLDNSSRRWAAEQIYPNSSGAIYISVHGIASLSAGDSLTAYAYQDSSGNLNAGKGDGLTYFHVWYISP